MSAPGQLDQAIAAFALHAVWQVPLLAGATWMAVRVGSPKVRAAHALWVATLLLCVAAPLASTWQGYRAARAQAQVSTASVSYSTDDAAQDVPAMQREPAWLRMLHKHFNAADGVTPFAFALPPRVARGITVAYMLLLALACLRFVIAWRRSRSLVRSASVGVPHNFAEAMQAQCEAMDCSVPQAALSDAVAGPLLAGVVRPTLLLPADSVDEMSAQEMEAVLAHELSHLKRNDPAWHAVCSLVLLPISFHPVAQSVAMRVRQTREMACDEAAAAHVGSTSRYAHALLCVAERMPQVPVLPEAVGLGLFDVARVDAASVRDGWSFSQRRSATAGLELFGAKGAMEERMQSMMNHNRTMSRRKRWARGLAAAAIATSGVAAACMIQVQPTFAAQQAGLAQPQADAQPTQQVLQVITEDHAPLLASGRSAEQHLRAASSRLHQAEAKATTDDDRNKIATAQQMLRMAQSELAEQSGPQTMTVRVMPQMKLDGLGQLDVQLKHLDDQVLQIKMGEQQVHVKILQADQQKKLFAMQKTLNSPEFQARMKAQIVEGEKLHLKLNAPELQVRLQKQQQAADAMRVQLDSPEFQVRIQKQVEAVQRVMKDTVMIAKLEPPVILVEPQDQPKVVKVSAAVVAGQIVTKAQPVYPTSAKEARISGAVVLHAIINESGNVETLAVVSSPDKDLSMSAMDAVRQWTYKPYLLNGKPTAVDTTITVHYSFGG